MKVELQAVTKSFGATRAVDGIDLTIESGRTTVLIGPSGCGKSSLLRLINGLLKPDNGRVLLDGQLLVDANVRELRHQMGYVVQDGGLFPHLTARDNIALLARHLGREASRIEQRLQDLIELTRFPAAGLDRFPAQLSGGQQQRVSLMRALMLDPKLLLLDEPLGALDPLVRAELQEDLRDIFQRLRKSVVFVTHDMGEAVYFGDTIVLLRGGRIVQQGPAKDIVHHPANDFVRKFIRLQRSPFDSLAEREA